MGSIDTTFEWMQLPPAEQLLQWRSFVSSIDCGDAGYHRYYPVLMPRWVRGDVPQVAGGVRESCQVVSASAWDRIDASTADLMFGSPPF